jgi:hypothetical protein
MSSTNPFPGLRSFDQDESDLFFGRSEQTAELVDRLDRNRVLVVVGTSSSGTSSLVRAGLIPALHGGLMAHGGSHWRVALMRPGTEPIVNLTQSLIVPDVLGPPLASDPGLSFALTEATLRRSSLGIVDCVRQARIPRDENVLIVVDQFEEVFRYSPFRYSRDADEQSPYVRLLLTAIRQKDLPIYVVLTLRADYLGMCSQFLELPEAINAGLYLVPQMTREQCREAIAGPLAVGGGRITAPLVNRLLNDVAEQPDALPILQHTLMRLWDFWSARGSSDPIDLADYESIGTMSSALVRHVEEAFHELRDEAGQRIAETVFKAVTDKGQDTRIRRRPTSLSELSSLADATLEQTAAVIDVFRRAGRAFLMPPTGVPLTAETVVDITNENLVRMWPRLALWIDEEVKSATLYVRLADAAARYRRGEASLWAGVELDLALRWMESQRPSAIWARRYHEGFEDAIAYLESSRNNRDDTRQSANRRESRTRATVWVLAVAVMTLFILSAFLLIYRR